MSEREISKLHTWRVKTNGESFQADCDIKIINLECENFLKLFTIRTIYNIKNRSVIVFIFPVIIDKDGNNYILLHPVYQNPINEEINSLEDAIIYIDRMINSAKVNIERNRYAVRFPTLDFTIINGIDSALEFCYIDKELMSKRDILIYKIKSIKSVDGKFRHVSIIDYDHRLGEPANVSLELIEV